MPKTIRLYHFVKDEYGLENIKNRRLKLSFADQVNDLFELRPFDFGDGQAARELREVWGGAIEKHSKVQGFVSFSKSWSVPTMWAHYADNHRGVCLGFDLPMSLADKIDYVEDLFPMDFQVRTDTAYNLKMVDFARKTKSKHWEYEEEWRFWYSLTDSEKLEKNLTPKGAIFTKFNKDLILKEVIFGHRSKLSTKEVQRQLITSDEIEFTTARPSFRAFKMVPQLRKKLQKW